VLARTLVHDVLHINILHELSRMMATTCWTSDASSSTR